MAVVVAASGTAPANDTTGRVPARRLTKDELVNTHKTYLKKQDNSPNAPRPVKQPLLSEAYPASTKSIRELDIVNHPSYFYQRPAWLILLRSH
jgi:hypothetical protein